MTEILFMGKPISYWIELDNKAESMKYADLIAEITELKRQNKTLEDAVVKIPDRMIVYYDRTTRHV